MYTLALDKAMSRTLLGRSAAASLPDSVDNMLNRFITKLACLPL